ncbi:MAG: hypothetical protein P8N57_01385 [Flavobacteriaceae bacterium]|nr:hypothetical protein [Flavobacteriaceae bacterium]
MKIFIRIMMVLALGMLFFNSTRINFDAPLDGDSGVALIGVMASACAFLLLFILVLSKKIAAKVNKK